MPLVLRRTLVLCALEATAEGTDAITNPATDSVLVDSVTLTPVIGHEERPGLHATVGGLASVPAVRLCDVELELELKGAGNGGGANPVAPDWEPLLRACCVRVEEDNGNHFRIYRPTVPNVRNVLVALTDDLTCTIWVYHDGVVHKIRGFRGSAKIVMESGKRLRMVVTGKGLMSSAGTADRPVDLAFPALADVTLDAAEPFMCHNSYVTLGAYAPVLSAMTLDLGVQIGERPDMYSGSGYAGVACIGREPTAQLNPEATTEGDTALLAAWGEGWWSRLATGPSMALFSSMLVTAAVGYRMLVQAPAAQLRSIKPGERNGLLIYELDCGLREVTGNDEWVITIY